MKNKSRLQLVIGSLILLVILVLILGSIAMAQGIGGQGAAGTGSQFSPQLTATPVPGGPGFITVSGIGFLPYVPSDQFGHYGHTIHCVSGNCVFDMEIDLPDGATITKFVVYYYDNAGNDLAGYLLNAPVSEDFASIMAQANSTGTGTTNRYAETTLITNPVIDNRSNAYLIEVYLPPSSDIHLIGARVDYQFGATLPIIRK